MVLEIAQIDVRPGTGAEFEAAVREAAPLLCRTQDCLRAELLRSLEVPGRYRLLVPWEMVENHTKDFQKSAAFQEWRRLAGPFFSKLPKVEHMVPVLSLCAQSPAARPEGDAPTGPVLSGSSRHGRTPP